MQPIDLSYVKTYPIAERPNLVKLTDLIAPDKAPPRFEGTDLDVVVEHIIAARRAARPVIWMMGAHVIKSGLSRILIDLMERGIVTHVAGNGAVSIHDFELALIGETSEDVPRGLEDGTFGMAEETGSLMHRAIQSGARDGLGYGTALGRFIAENEARFPHREISVLYNAYTLGIPATIHATVGTDIIHQHPDANFAALGATSGTDFRLFVASVSQLNNGVFLNFGSAVTGPEVFLKALTIVRNLGYVVEKITTANFDLISLGPDYHSPVSKQEPVYYYRPRKNIINRPTAMGGQGYHIVGDHQVTIPNLYHRIISQLDRADVHYGAPEPQLPDTHGVLDALVSRSPSLQTKPGEQTDLLHTLTTAYRVIADSLRCGGTLFLAGNGGSMADALHISGEMLKSYAHRRILPDRLRDRLLSQPDGELLVRNLEPGLRAVVLGINPSLSSAVANDMPDRDVNLAQELVARARPGDVFLGISTSGNARNVAYAAQTARALGLTVVGLTGCDGGRLVEVSDIAVRVPADRTDRVQELHIQCYHALCEMLELEFFSEDQQ
ncbi:MAG: SIS domain-containing protein [Chloroflexi bacterium]|nr:SIS domain-containing protein [Chloroflexota bacterium]